jgi:hypothetical protein
LILIDFPSPETRVPDHRLRRFVDLESPTETFHHPYERGTEVKWMLTTIEWLKSCCCFKVGDTSVFVAPKVGTIFFQNDYKNKGASRYESLRLPRGHLEPCIAVTMRDVRVLNHDGRLDGFALVGPEYEWPQYLASLPKDCL